MGSRRSLPDRQTNDAPQRNHALREVVNGWRWIVRTGGATVQCTLAPTRMLSTDLPPCSSSSQHPQRWLKAGVGVPLGHDLHAPVRAIAGRAPAPRALCHRP